MGAGSAGSSAGGRRDPYATFRPFLGRWVAYGMAVVVAVSFGFVALTATGTMDTPGNRASMVVFALLVVVLLWRLGSVRAVVDADGVVVRNLVHTQRFAWTQVVSVRFGPDQPWLRLDVSDGQTVSVLAVQRADGARAEAEARRMASLAQAHGEAPERD
ncbi:PH (Pleckstrin Homology) domain-containing protein [Sediminihabitans luteus]|uniref:PH (Pleckstrin Homology) domain-containing protein n=1 Tax=Sediminihabitans luteus TaxID=1138585 RepID=A0A2M9CQL6_9CELL|nr:PH (Pleckstrin Homology) domain-containing protein [Sediminihabitans luteus]GII99083.1 hypothetical protein Slu03_14610 [Sediminihabitans luteus]